MQSQHVLMIRPVRFGYNEQTAVNNAFQSQDGSLSSAEIQEKARTEFDTFAAILRAVGVQVTVIDDTTEPHTPDSIFPNNWISFHPDRIGLYPMFAPNRRAERRMDIVEQFGKGRQVVDYTAFEAQNVFLEGTGSMILDREHRVAYACLSPRTDKALFERFCADFGFQAVSFTSLDEHEKPVYHTNVMMAIGTKVAVVCLESIADRDERELVRQSLEKTGHHIVAISHAQMNQFAGNMLAVNNASGQEFMVMSKRAHDSLSNAQRAAIEAHCTLLVIPIDVIETYGGGSVRCMLAEVYE